MENFLGKFIPLTLLVGFCSSQKDDYHWRCTDEVCQKKLCPDLPDVCMDSKRALLIPSTDECNCCNHCFIYLKEGEDCLKKNSDLELPTVMCGPGLTCNENGKCVKMPKGRKDPDFYENYKCDDNGMCYCHIINEMGEEERIFGQFSLSKMNENEKQCECSITAYKAMKMDLRVLPFNDIYQPSVRCLSNGQFDPLQCIEDVCGCVDKDTGIPDEKGFIYSVRALGRNHPHCFDPSRHKAGEYYTPCERRRNKLMQEINEKYWKDLNFIHFKKINCYPDGSEVS